jgi:hypothetical protein
MSFVKTPDQVVGGIFFSKHVVYFKPAEVMTILYESKTESIRRNLPPPLEPYEKPYVVIAYNNFKSVNFDRGLRGPGYKETALYIPAYYQGVIGTFVVAMTLDTDQGSFLGRELNGHFKKVGTVDHWYDGSRYVAFSARHGIPYATLEGFFDEEPDDPDFLKELGKITSSDPERPGYGINYTFTWTPYGTDKQFATGPALCRVWKSKHDLGVAPRAGRGKVQLVWSDDDPWADLEVVRVLGASLVTVESRMYTDHESFPVDPELFRPYSFYGWDLRPYKDFEREQKELGL